MKFAEFAKYLQELESTGSRIDMTKILAQLFKQASPEDGRLIAYLSQGRLGPAYNNPDMGVADKQVVKAIAAAFELAPEKVLEKFKHVGDLGTAAQELSRHAGEGRTIKQVHAELVDIATARGAGSQEKKQQLIGELLIALEPLSAKYAIRITLGKLRTGFSDMTVLDALSWMITGNKRLRSGIEQMYNVRADLGEVVQAIKANPVPQKLEPRIGTPVLMARAERATSSEEIWERNKACAVEYKLDGLRIQAHIHDGKVQMFSRGLDDVSAMYPDVVEGLQNQIKGNAIVEGEMIAVDAKGKFLPFQETVQRKRKYDIVEMMQKLPLKLYVFDVLAIDGKSVFGEENQKRWELLKKIVKPGSCVELMVRIKANSTSDIEKFFQVAIADGTEGIIAKKLTGPYQAGGRDFNWIKYKKSYSTSALSDTIDAVVMGYDVGQGKRSGFGIGDFLIGLYDKKTDQYKTIAKIGTGLTDEEWRKMKQQVDAIKSETIPKNYVVSKAMLVDVWAKPQIVVEIHADEITRSPMHTSGLALRFPRLISWRKERQPTDATYVAELENMYTKVRIGGDK